MPYDADRHIAGNGGRGAEKLADVRGAKFECADIQNLPYPDESFDVVIANMMLYHVPDIARGLSEVRRVLRRDGRFFC